MKVLTYDDLRPQKGISYSKVQIWRLEKNNKFPKRIQLGPGRHGWLDSEIDEWIMARAAERETAGCVCSPTAKEIQRARKREENSPTS
jgi:prophage regulatory protein